MHSKRQGKPRTTLFLTAATVMATMIAMPEAGYGLEALRQQRLQEAAEKKKLESDLAAEKGRHVAEKAKVASLDTYSKALKDPAAALDGGHALGIELARVAVHAVTHSHKIAALEVIEAGGDVAAKENVAKALGLNPADAYVRVDVGHFITAAKKRLVKLPQKKAAIVNLEKYKTAMADPAVALAVGGAGTLTQAITDAVLVHGSAAALAGIPAPASVRQKIHVLESIEGAGGGVANDAAKAAVATALGLDPVGARVRQEVGSFIALAHLDGIGGANYGVKMSNVLTQVQAATHVARGAHGLVAGDMVVAPAVVNSTLQQLLTRIGL